MFKLLKRFYRPKVTLTLAALLIATALMGGGLLVRSALYQESLHGTASAQSADTDGDGIPEATDNCPLVSNADQANADGDAFGDLCDSCSDTVFGTSGIVTTDIGSSTADGVRSIAIQSDGKVVVAGTSSNDFAVARYNIDGSLDATFDADGKLVTDLNSGSVDKAYGMGIQNDGKIVVAGVSKKPGDNFFALARYNGNGALDNSFGPDHTGIVKSTFSTQDDYDEARNLVIQSDGKIVVGGHYDTSNPRFALARFNTDGTPDTGFGTGGMVRTTIASGSLIFTLGLQSDGKIIAAGTAYSGGPTNWDYAVARYNTDGSLDTGFGTNGTTYFTIESGGYADGAGAIAIDSAGRIVLAGRSNTASQYQFSVVRLTSSGALDASFSDDGVYTQEVMTSGDGDYASSVAWGVAIQSTGQIVVSGMAKRTNSGIDFVLIRLNDNGTADSAFGVNGVSSTDINNHSSDDAFALIKDKNDGLYLAGQISDGSNPDTADFVIAKYNTDGSLDASVVCGCGNGFMEAGEQCDDNNVLSGDGCSATCQIEAVNPVCGNGTIDSGEQCDDGNAVEGDGCSAVCTVETDTDQDGIFDPVDNCPVVPNPEQWDTDADSIGDSCDAMTVVTNNSGVSKAINYVPCSDSAYAYSIDLDAGESIQVETNCTLKTTQVTSVVGKVLVGAYNAKVNLKPEKSLILSLDGNLHKLKIKNVNFTPSDTLEATVGDNNYDLHLSGTQFALSFNTTTANTDLEVVEGIVACTASGITASVGAGEVVALKLNQDGSLAINAVTVASGSGIEVSAKDIPGEIKVGLDQGKSIIVKVDIAQEALSVQNVNLNPADTLAVISGGENYACHLNGTEFSISMTADGTKLAVNEGLVDCSNSGVTARIDAGGAVALNPNSTTGSVAVSAIEVPAGSKIDISAFDETSNAVSVGMDVAQTIEVKAEQAAGALNIRNINLTPSDALVMTTPQAQYSCNPLGTDFAFDSTSLRVDSGVVTCQMADLRATIVAGQKVGIMIDTAGTATFEVLTNPPTEEMMEVTTSDGASIPMEEGQAIEERHGSSVVKILNTAGKGAIPVFSCVNNRQLTDGTVGIFLNDSEQAEMDIVNCGTNAETGVKMLAGTAPVASFLTGSIDQYNVTANSVVAELPQSGDVNILSDTANQTTSVSNTGTTDVIVFTKPDSSLNPTSGSETVNTAPGSTTTMVDSDGDGIIDTNDQCPAVSGPASQFGCPHADITNVKAFIVDLKGTGICGYLPNGRAKTVCEKPVEGASVKVFDRENADFKAAYNQWPSRNLLDNIFEANIGLAGACATDAAGTCTIGEDHPGKYLVISKYTEGTKNVYTGRFKNFKWKHQGWHVEEDDSDTDNFTPPATITKNLYIFKTIRKDGTVLFLPGFRSIVTGSQLNITHPEYTVWNGDEELYPFAYESEENWDVDVCMNVPAGYELEGILDENEEVVSTTECVHTLVAATPKVFLFKLIDIASPEPSFTFNLTAKHNNKVSKKAMKVDGIRQKNVKKLEATVEKQVEKLAPKWEKAAAKHLKKLPKKNLKPGKSALDLQKLLITKNFDQNLLKASSMQALRPVVADVSVPVAAPVAEKPGILARIWAAIVGLF